MCAYVYVYAVINRFVCIPSNTFQGGNVILLGRKDKIELIEGWGS